MAYGTIKVDTITFTNGAGDKSVTISGLVQNPTFTGNVTVTGTVSGTTATFTTGTFTSLTGATSQGTTATYTSGSFTSLTGVTTSGTTANFVSGVFTTQISGATITGTAGAFATLTGGVATLTSGVFALGTEALPSITFTGDTDTGIYSPGANQVVITTSGTGKLFVDAAGFVGVGTSTSVSSILHVQQPADDNGITLSHASKAGIWKIYHSGVSSQNLAFFQNNGTSDALSYLMGRDSHEWYTGGIVKAAIDSSGRLLVGTSSALTNVLIKGDLGSSAATTPQEQFALAANNYNAGLSVTNYSASGYGGVLSLNSSKSNTLGTNALVDNTIAVGTISFNGNDGTNFVPCAEIKAAVDGTPGTNDMPGRLVFSTTADGESSPTERMRITNDGSISTKTTPASLSATGTTIFGASSVAPDAVNITRSAGYVLAINRTTDDGTLIEFYQDTTLEGTISVSGTTVSYNGAHLSRWSQLLSGAERIKILRGTVLSNVDEMCEWDEEDNEQLNRMKVSDVEGDKNVSGVFQAWDDDDDTCTNDFYCAMTGDFIIRIAAGVIVERGDLLMSAGDGTAKPQDDDIIRSKTIAKVTSTNVSCIYDDGSYCVPCVLMAC